MKITNIEVFPLMLPMKQNFVISSGSVGDQAQGAPHVFVRITTEEGGEGWGEARPSHRWSYETLETVTSTIATYLRPHLLGTNAADLQAIHAIMNREIKISGGSGQPIAKAALDMALHDLLGNSREQSLSEMWFSSYRSSINLTYLISTSNPEEAEQKSHYARERGYKGIDVKIGLNPGLDIEILEAVKSASKGMFFRVDANQAYTLPEAVKLARYMEQIEVDVFEQPLRANDLYGHAALRRKTDIPIALDESIWTPGDVIQAIRAEACDSVVIKTTKMGGLLQAKLCGEVAREGGLGLLGGGLTESKLGLSASAHLFHYLQIKDPVDLNGPIFLQDDPIEAGPVVTDGLVELPSNLTGIGCKISFNKLQQFLVNN